MIKRPQNACYFILSNVLSDSAKTEAISNFTNQRKSMEPEQPSFMQHFALFQSLVLVGSVCVNDCLFFSLPLWKNILEATVVLFFWRFLLPLLLRSYILVLLPPPLPPPPLPPPPLPHSVVLFFTLQWGQRVSKQSFKLFLAFKAPSSSSSHS